MNKIMVVGISSGVGKSTFATKLGELLNIEVTHLDSLFWKPGWIEATVDEFSKPQREIVKRPQWIIEGNYSNTFDLRITHADTIIYLELPLYVCLYRVIKRWFTNLGTTRPDMGHDCEEKMDWKFIKFIVTTYKPRKQKMNDRIARFVDSGPDKKAYILKSKEEISCFLKTLEAGGLKINGNIS